MEIAALIISIISIVASVIMTIWQIIITKHVNRINLNKNEFDLIFNDYLIKEIPQARKFLKFDEKNKITGINHIIETLHNMRKDSLYYNYNDKKFYDELEKKILELEDYLTNNSNTEYEGSRQTNILNHIDELIENIYSIINNKKIKG